MITTEKIDNPYGIAFELNAPAGGILSGWIYISGKKHHLQIISRDILAALSDAIEDKNISCLLPQDIALETVEDIPNPFRKEAIEVKLKLMACNAFQEMDKVNRAKLEAIERYHSMLYDEQQRHLNEMAEIERWLQGELDRLGE